MLPSPPPLPKTPMWKHRSMCPRLCQHQLHRQHCQHCHPVTTTRARRWCATGITLTTVEDTSMTAGDGILICKSALRITLAQGTVRRSNPVLRVTQNWIPVHRMRRSLHQRLDRMRNVQSAVRRMTGCRTSGWRAAFSALPARKRSGTKVGVRNAAVDRHHPVLQRLLRPVRMSAAGFNEARLPRRAARHGQAPGPQNEVTPRNWKRRWRSW